MEVRGQLVGVCALLLPRGSYRTNGLDIKGLYLLSHLPCLKHSYIVHVIIIRIQVSVGILD